jgi:hypothetical protein
MKIGPAPVVLAPVRPANQVKDEEPKQIKAEDPKQDKEDEPKPAKKPKGFQLSQDPTQPSEKELQRRKCPE